MTQTIEAIYQNGMFRPLSSLDRELEEGEKVVINVKSYSENAKTIIKLAENFYEGLSEDEIDEIEKIALDRSNFFGDRDL